MRVLMLGPAHEQMEVAVRNAGDVVLRTEERLRADSAALRGTDWIVSYGYRHKLPAAVLNQVNYRAVNLHISLLPWNRGADPNLWSFLDDTPKGATVHFMDDGLDTGDNIVQREITHDPSGTLRSTYVDLTRLVEQLFLDVWPALRAGCAPRHPQRGSGTLHRTQDKEPYLHLLTHGWDTPATFPGGAAKRNQRHVQHG